MGPLTCREEYVERIFGRSDFFRFIAAWPAGRKNQADQNEKDNDKDNNPGTFVNVAAILHYGWSPQRGLAVSARGRGLPKARYCDMP